MNLPFEKNIPAHYYEMALNEANKLLGQTTDDLVSIKVRPLAELPHATIEEMNNAYVYNSEYQNILNYLAKEKLIKEGYVSRGKAYMYSIGPNEEFVFVEHETGPEIVAGLALMTASLSLAKTVVELVLYVIKAVDEENKKKQQGQSSGRYYGAKAISIEKRTKSGAKIITTIELPAEGEISKEELLQLITQEL